MYNNIYLFLRNTFGFFPLFPFPCSYFVFVPNIITVGSREVPYRFLLRDEFHTNCSKYYNVNFFYASRDHNPEYLIFNLIALDSLTAPRNLDINGLDRRTDAQQSDVIKDLFPPFEVRNPKNGEANINKFQ